MARTWKGIRCWIVVQEARCQGCCGPSVYFHHIPAGNYVSGGEVFEDYAGKRPHV